MIKLEFDVNELKNVIRNEIIDVLDSRVFNSDSDSILTVKDVSELYKVSNSTVYRWFKSGKIHGLDTNGVLRFSKKNLESVLNKDRNN